MQCTLRGVDIHMLQCPETQFLDCVNSISVERGRLAGVFVCATRTNTSNLQGGYLHHPQPLCPLEEGEG